LLRRQFRKAGLQGLFLGGAFLVLLGTFIRQQIEHVVAEDEPVPRHLSPVGKRFEPGDDTSPFHEVRFRVELLEFPPDHNRGLLEHLVGVGVGGQKRANEPAQIGFMMGEQRHESLVAVVLGKWLRFAGPGHRVILPLPGREKPNEVFWNGFSRPPLRVAPTPNTRMWETMSHW